MKRRVFWAMAGLSLLLTLLLALLFSEAVRHEMLSALSERLGREAQVLAGRMQSDQAPETIIRNTLTDARITWIAPDGRVLYDSMDDSQDMDNHLLRSEIQQAMQATTGSAVRYSATIKRNMVYRAQKLGDGSILRLAAPERDALRVVMNLRAPLLGGLAAFTLIAFVLSTLLSKALLRPIDRIDLQNPVDTCPYEELMPLSRRIAAQQNELKQQLQLLESAREETETVLNAMSEGFIIIGNDENVLSINRSACRLLNTDPLEAQGKPLSLINRSPEVLALLKTMQEKGSAQTSLTLEGRHYEIKANIVSRGKKNAVVLISDVTDRVEGEQMRKRFTANVSHELRTPMTTILGYAEMLDSGMVKSEDQQTMFARIRREAERLLRLIEDILKLSRIDEGYASGKHESVSLKPLVEKTAQALEAAAEKKNVLITVHAEDAFVWGDETLLGEMIYNLLDNAIKYNKQGGVVEATIRKEKNEVVLGIRDNGIGIEQSQQEKIFERFYRTDKSRSKETGGTGLGLSIVKHAAAYHGATIRVDSRPGEGTLMEVIFPQRGITQGL